MAFKTQHTTPSAEPPSAYLRVLLTLSQSAGLETYFSILEYAKWHTKMARYSCSRARTFHRGTLWHRCEGTRSQRIDASLLTSFFQLAGSKIKTEGRKKQLLPAPARRTAVLRRLLRQGRCAPLASERPRPAPLAARRARQGGGVRQRGRGLRVARGLPAG